MNILLVGAELFRAEDRRTYVTNIIVALSNLAKAPNQKNEESQMKTLKCSSYVFPSPISIFILK